MGYGLNGLDSTPGRDKIFLFATESKPARGHPSSYPVVAGDCFPRGKADETSPPTTEIKNSGDLPAHTDRRHHSLKSGLAVGNCGQWDVSGSKVQTFQSRLQHILTKNNNLQSLYPENLKSKVK
jgi:hypothetical protein